VRAVRTFTAAISLVTGLEDWLSGFGALQGVAGNTGTASAKLTRQITGTNAYQFVVPSGSSNDTCNGATISAVGGLEEGATGMSASMSVSSSRGVGSSLGRGSTASPLKTRRRAWASSRCSELACRRADRGRC